jgi:endothelin-converting enzyme/putative endopeptidase
MKIRAAAICILAAASCAKKEEAPPAPAIPLPALRVYDPAAIDRSADACTNFYQFACGGWERSNPRPADEGAYFRSWTQYAREVDDYVRLLIEAAGAKAAPGADEKNVGAYFNACMDEATIEANGLAPLAERFAMIDAMESIREFGAVHGALVNRMSASGRPREPLISLYVWGDPAEGGSLTRIYAGADLIGFPAPDYYVSGDEQSAALRAQYQAFLADVLALIGYAPDEAAALAPAILAMEVKAVADAQSYAAARNEASTAESLFTIETLAARYPNIDWPAMFAARGAAATPDKVVVSDPDFLSAANDALAEENLERVKAYLKLAAAFDLQQFLPANIRAKHFEFFRKALRGQEEPYERWRTCVGAVRDAMPEAVGRIFVEASGIEKDKPASLEVFNDIRRALRQRIETADWVSEATRAAALEKLGALRASFVMPDEWPDDRSLAAVEGDAVATLERFSAPRRASSFARLGQPLDINEWFDPPTYVSAFQVNETNAIYATAAQMLMLDIGSDDPAVVYGGLGTFLGHEISHGYDKLGAQYDGAGRVRDWWAPADAAAFAEKTQCVSDEASTYQYPSGDKVNGDLVVSEVAADITGISLAHDAFGKSKQGDDRDGLTAEQRFYTASAQIFCMQASDEAWRGIASSDSHTWGAPGINMALRNTPGFADAFGCKPGETMSKAQADICRGW